MLLLKIILSFIVLIVIPIVLGLLFTKFRKEKNNIFLAFVIGYLFEFASFEVIYVPMYFFKCSFQMVKKIWMICIFSIMIISIILNRKRGKEIFQSTINTLKAMPKIMFIFFLLLAIQIYFPVRYMQNVDPDDAFYLATVNTTIETNSLFQYNAYDGSKYQTNMLRYSMSGLTIWFATLSEFLKIHPAIVQHTIWPSVGIILEFTVYALIGNQLWKKDKEKLAYFLILLSTVHMFGFISIYTNFTFFTYRSWQGKALIGNLIIPATWLFYQNCMENDAKLMDWVIFLFAMISSCFVTEMGVFLIPMEVGILSFITLIQKRKPLKFIQSIACCLPQIVVGVIYLIFQ